jgi:hydroxyacylglutathione hydrolase
MFFKQFYDEGLAQASFMIGCQRNGQAIVVDPRRDIGIYLEEATRQGLNIVAVTETHIHADYLSGVRELAAATGAKIYLSDEGGADWSYQFAHTGLQHGSEIRLGNIVLKVLHTPGHTPEHISFLVTDHAAADAPGFLLSGDFVFVGDIGRPDLLDEAAGGVDTRFEGAKQMFASLRDQFLTLPDYVQVHPGHGAGSACGKALGAVSSSTVGYERLFAWWAKYLEKNDLDGFIAELLAGQPDAPAYFGRMKRLNKVGAELRSTENLPELDAQQLLESGSILIDTRSREMFQKGTIKGGLHLPSGKNFSTWAAWLIDPENQQNYMLVARDASHAQALRDELSRVGIDRVVGFIRSLEDLPLEPQMPVEPANLEALLPKAVVLDVRAKSEYNAGHIGNARQLHAGRLYKHLSDIPRDQTVVLHCQSGARSAAAISLLRSEGFTNILEMQGGYAAWAARQ